MKKLFTPSNIATYLIGISAVLAPLFTMEIRDYITSVDWSKTVVLIGILIIFFTFLSQFIRLSFQKHVTNELKEYTNELSSYKVRLSELTETNNAAAKHHSDSVNRWVLHGNINSLVIRKLFLNKLEDKATINSVAKEIAQLVNGAKATNNLEFLNNESHFSPELIKAITNEYADLQKQ